MVSSLSTSQHCFIPHEAQARDCAVSMYRPIVLPQRRLENRMPCATRWRILIRGRRGVFRTAARVRMIQKPSRRILAVIALVVAVGGFLSGAYAFHLFGTGTNCWVRPTSAPNTAIFTVVMANEGLNVGYNGSKAHGASASNPWSVMNVTVNQTVIIHVINNDSQPHGFAIT